MAHAVTCELELRGDSVYMVLPTCDCGGGVSFAMRVFSERALTLQDVTAMSDLVDSSDEEESGSEDEEEGGEQGEAAAAAAAEACGIVG